MSDVVLQTIVTNVFWLIILIVFVGTFRHELRNLLNSLGKVKVAGASFELKDSRATIEYYVVLTNIIIEILSKRESAEKLSDLISDLSVKQLARFALKYSREVPNDAKEIELLKNVGIILRRRGSSHEALSFLNALLKDSPHDPDILNLKANILADTDERSKQLEAETIRDQLVVTHPQNATYHFNRALSKAYFGKDSEVIADLRLALDLGFWKKNPKFLEIREFKSLRERSEEFAELQKLFDEMKGSKQT